MEKEGGDEGIKECNSPLNERGQRTVGQTLKRRK